MKLDDGMNYDWTPLQQVLCTMLSKIAKKSVIVGNFAIHCASANTQSESVEMRIRLSLIGHLCQIVHATKS